jgi:hypothetical protein
MNLAVFLLINPRDGIRGSLGSFIDLLAKPD